jgi:hypothetical protein
LEQSVGCILLSPENWSSRSDAFSCHRKIGAVGRMHFPATGKLEQSVGCILLPPENWSSRSDAFSCHRKIGAVGRMHFPATGKLEQSVGCILLPPENCGWRSDAFTCHRNFGGAGILQRDFPKSRRDQRSLCKLRKFCVGGGCNGGGGGLEKLRINPKLLDHKR